MLELKNITKDYVTSSETVNALRGVNISFRDREFVSILGPSGCGKTTLLNIVGGLDRYTSGDLIINGRSTESFKDRDWDVYRNHRVGFIFQSYNLIPHQTVLGNVELALTIAGMGKEERIARAKAALDKVGLSSQYYKKPNQLSGGQCQRVAIARALVNDPEILLADEPTGALDTVTSVQIMELVKEIAKERLVIMVTHNPELAEEYSTRIVRLLDGEVIEDTNPVGDEEYTEYVKLEEEKKKAELAAEEEIIKAAEEASKDKKKARAKAIKDISKKKRKSKEKAKMSLFTAFSLSIRNLSTKKGRTFMTSFAGSIGIIGIALILALSTGINAFIAQVQEDTLSTYPLTIQKHTQDMAAMLSAMTSVSDSEDYRDSGKIYVDDSLGTMMGAMSSTVENNLEAFKTHIDTNYDQIKDYVSDVQYTYDYNLQVYTADGKVKVGIETVFAHMGEAFSGMSELMEMGGGMDVFSEMINNQELLDQQYDVISGQWPKEYNEVVLVVNSNNQLSKMTLYMLGMLDPNEIDEEIKDLKSGNYVPDNTETSYTYEDILNMRFKLLTTSDFFAKTDNTYDVDGSDVKYPIWNDIRESLNYDQEKFVTDNGIEIKISGIVRPKDGAAATSISGAVGYTKDLTDYILEENATSEVINQQKATPTVNVLTGLGFERTVYTKENIQELINKIDSATIDMFYSVMTNEILKDENLSAMLNVNRANINTMFILLPEEQQAEILSKIVASAYVNKPMECAVVFQTLNNMPEVKALNIDVDEKNIAVLLPQFNKMQSMPLVTALGVPGIIGLANPAVVDEVINEINTNHPEFAASPMGAVSKDNLGMMIGNLSSDEQTAAYSKMIGSINEGNDSMLSLLCAIVSQTAKAEINKDNLATKLPTLEGMEGMTSRMLALGGMPGFADYADEATMTEVYGMMNDFTKELEINDKIFSLLLVAMPDDTFTRLEETLYSMAPQIDATYESVLKTLDDAEKASPASINFYAKDFESKDKIEAFIRDYNTAAEEAGRESDEIENTDHVGALMSSVTIIVNAISYVLIAFVSISLVVSSIMIGIITNISVLERTKEIGILRAIGASKKDVSRVFNAETLIIGLAAGLLGIITTLVLCIPITAIVQFATGLDNIRAILPWQGAIILVAISMVLTLIAGIIPSRSAAKKDPVIALRSE